MIEASDFKRFVLPTTQALGKAITESFTHDVATSTRKLRDISVVGKLTAAEVDIFPYITELKLTTDSRDGTGSLSLEAEDSKHLHI
jgi:hypothetical protein